ncbi:MAG: WG repeat-containing protein [Rikenellaceae bacterium]|nr:WG repeat-containing protein [Rikenellaceae bacterium]
MTMSRIRPIFALLGLLLSACKPSPSTDDYLVRITAGENGFGDPCGYVDRRGDTIIPPGQYLYCYTDTLRTHAVVVNRPERRESAYDLCLAIDRRGRKMFNVLWFDNGPDYVCDGLMRIRDDAGRVGYADTLGRIAIAPQYAFGTPFDNGRAKVTFTGCERPVTDAPDEEHRYWDSDQWLVIDKTGQVVDE